MLEYKAFNAHSVYGLYFLMLKVFMASMASIFVGSGA
jgi:hypothetical protein